MANKLIRIDTKTEGELWINPRYLAMVFRNSAGKHYIVMATQGSTSTTVREITASSYERVTSLLGDEIGDWR